MKSNYSWCYLVCVGVVIIAGVTLRLAYLQQESWPAAPELLGFVAAELVAEPSPTPRLLCDVVSTAELETILGETLQGPVSTIDHDRGIINSQQCFWSAASGAFTPTISIQLRNAEAVTEVLADLIQDEATTSAIIEATAAATIEATAAATIEQPLTVWQFEQERNRTRPGYSDISNLGDEAYVSPTGLYLLSGNRMVRIVIAVPDRAQSQTVMEQIARLTLQGISPD